MKNKTLLIAGGVGLAAATVFLLRKKIVVPNHPLLQDPVVRDNYIFLKKAYNDNSKVVFYSQVTGNKSVVNNFKDWLHAWMQKQDAKIQTNPPVIDVDTAIINRARWQGQKGKRVILIEESTRLGSINLLS